MLYKRDWRKYDKNVLNVVLAQERWEICDDTVQNCWNDIENKLIVIVDRLAPMVEFHIECFFYKCNTLIFVKYSVFIDMRINSFKM